MNDIINTNNNNIKELDEQCKNISKNISLYNIVKQQLNHLKRITNCFSDDEEEKKNCVVSTEKVKEVILRDFFIKNMKNVVNQMEKFKPYTLSLVSRSRSIDGDIGLVFIEQIYQDFGKYTFDFKLDEDEYEMKTNINLKILFSKLLNKLLSTEVDCRDRFLIAVGREKTDDNNIYARVYR